MRVIEYRFYSPVEDRECLRLMMADRDGLEYFCIIPVEEGRLGRVKRRDAIDRLAEAIDDPFIKPGEVRWRYA